MDIKKNIAVISGYTGSKPAELASWIANDKFNSERENDSFYIEGRGYTPQSRECVKRNAVSRLINITSLLMFVFVVMRILIPGAGSGYLAEKLTSYNVNDWLGSLVGTVISIIGICFECLVLVLMARFMMRMPAKKHRAKAAETDVKDGLFFTGLAFGAATLLSVLAHIIPGYSPVSPETRLIFLGRSAVFGSTVTGTIVSIVWIVLLSVLTELVVHTQMFRGLQRFGDGFAIVVSALASSVVLSDISSAVTMFVISLITGYITAKTDTVIPAIKTRLFFLLVVSGFYSIGTSPARNVSSSMLGVYFAAMAAISILLIAVSGKMKRPAGLFEGLKKNAYPARELVAIYHESVPAVLVLILCLALMVAKTFIL